MKIGSELNDTQQEYYLLWWQARLATILATVTTALVVILVLIIVWLFPLKQVVPMLVQAQHQQNQVVTIEPLEKGVKGFDILAEQLARQFVVDVESFDGISEGARVKKLSLFATPELEPYLKQIDAENSESINKEFKERGVTRSVEIISSASLAPNAPNIWQIHWESSDFDPKTRQVTKAEWVSTLTAEFRETKTSLENRFVNPIGFTVIGYHVASRKG